MTGVARALGDLRSPELAELLARGQESVAILPAGSVEAHGPHLPLDTDTRISVAVAREAAHKLAALGFVAVWFPALHYGVTEWARSFSGTVSIAPDLVETLVVQTARAALAMGFRHVVLTNAHLEPGHIQTLRRAATRFETETGTPLLFPDATRRKFAERLTAEFRSGACHAGQYETSLILAIAPERVDMDRARTLPRLDVPLHEHIAAGARDFVECGLEQAYCGEPAAATVEEGLASLEILSDMVVELVDERARR